MTRFPQAILIAILMALLLLAAAPLTVDARLYPSLREWSAAEAVASSTTGVHAAVTDTGATQVVTTAITDPPCPRNLTVTAGGTSTDVKALSVTVTGKRAGKTITEDIGPFTVNTTGTVAGTKIFDTVTSISIPAHDGTGATTAVGFGELLGLPYQTPYPIKLGVYRNGSADASAVLTAGASLETTHLDTSTNLSGQPVSLIYLRR